MILRRLSETKAGICDLSDVLLGDWDTNTRQLIAEMPPHDAEELIELPVFSETPDHSAGNLHD